MTTLDIHKNIKDKLNFFLVNKKIPNIIFHGPNGSGKRTIVNEFVNNIYNNDKEMYKAYVMNVNCAHGKGIKFVRDELKFFAKTHVNIKNNFSCNFKTIIMLNADKLTIDAQSALRRCIELFSHTTRFFIIVEDKYKLLKPIISRFCEIFIVEPIIDNKKINLHNYILNNCFQFKHIEDVKRQKLLKQNLKNISGNNFNLFDKASELYELGFSGIDLMKYIESSNVELKKKYQSLLAFQKIKKEFRNEKLLLIFILNFFFIHPDIDLENISFM